MKIDYDVGLFGIEISVHHIMEVEEDVGHVHQESMRISHRFLKELD